MQFIFILTKIIKTNENLYSYFLNLVTDGLWIYTRLYQKDAYTLNYF